MANTQIYTQEAANVLATEVKAALAGSKFRLVKAPFNLTAQTTRAQLLAAEADFDGYPAGGYTLATWTGPQNNPGGGSIITSPLVNPAYGPAGSPPVTNGIAAWWIEDATPTVRTSGAFDPVVTMTIVGDGFPFIDQLVYGRNPQLSS